MVLDATLVNTQQYKVRIKGKVEQSREKSSASLHLGVSYRKGSLRVTLDYGRQLYFLLTWSRKLVLISSNLHKSSWLFYKSFTYIQGIVKIVFIFML